MISVVRLWETLSQMGKTGTSGYQTADEFNRDLASSQTSAMSLLCPWYAKNTMVQEILAPFVTDVPVSNTEPSDCFYFLGATINDIAAFPITPVQAPLYKDSPIRKPSAKNLTAYWYMIDGGYQFIHDGSLTGTMQYIRMPKEASIALTPVSTPERDYVTPTSVDDLEWPESAFNLILGMMLQKLGIEMEDDLLMSVGIQTIQYETQKT